MPFTIRKVRRGRYAIVRKDTGKVVGYSSSRRKAGASIGHRESGHRKSRKRARRRKR